MDEAALPADDAPAAACADKRPASVRIFLSVRRHVRSGLSLQGRVFPRGDVGVFVRRGFHHDDPAQLPYSAQQTFSVASARSACHVGGLRRRVCARDALGLGDRGRHDRDALPDFCQHF